jgi:hypothetical protein
MTSLLLQTVLWCPAVADVDGRAAADELFCPFRDKCRATYMVAIPRPVMCGVFALPYGQVAGSLTRANLFPSPTRQTYPSLRPSNLSRHDNILSISSSIGDSGANFRAK